MTLKHPHQVKKLWELVGQKSTKGEIQCDAWGLRKFVSFFIKRLAQTTKPRDPRLTKPCIVVLCMHKTPIRSPKHLTKDKNNRQLKRILLESWYPDRVHELLSDNEEDCC